MKVGLTHYGPWILANMFLMVPSGDTEPDKALGRSSGLDVIMALVAVQVTQISMALGHKYGFISGD